MTVSSLAAKTVPASSSNYSAGRGGNSICKITPHHMAGKLTAEACARLFQQAGRGASANYCIGYDGEIVCSVPEENRSWCSSNGDNDRKAITIECANSSTGGDWPISDATWNSLVNLCADICTRYDFTLSYTGNSAGSLTEHRMFASTACPGEYLHNRMAQLASEVNAKIGAGGSATPPTQTSGGSADVPAGSYTVVASALNVRAEPTTNAAIVASYSNGQTVNLDGWSAVADGYVWGRYTAYSGNLRYVAVRTVSGEEYLSMSAGSGGGSDYGVPAGTYTVRVSALNVRSAPSTNAEIVASYSSGQTVNLDNWCTTADGYVWGRYTAYSGATRYVAVRTTSGEAYLSM